MLFWQRYHKNLVSAL